LKFTSASLPGVYLIDIERAEDDRGSFGRTWCLREFDEHDLPSFVQANVSFNHRAGTVRGMHWQLAPHAEAKLVRCSRGALFDVVVDLRPESATYLQSFAEELSEGNGRMLFVPTGFAHGFQTLEDRTEVSYMISEFYAPEFQRGARYDDPAFAIEWPMEVTVIADKDRRWPPFRT
jgi:dTDP-4-dehydrorhamnose 3,5-epimerase